MPTRPRVHEFDVHVDEFRVARSGLGGTPLAREAEWWAEHLVLAGLVRCTLASMDYSARRAGSNCTGSGKAHGVVTKREADGRYALVEVDATLEVHLAPRPVGDALDELLAWAEAGCFVGNSLAVEPTYHWIVNGDAIS